MQSWAPKYSAQSIKLVVSFERSSLRYYIYSIQATFWDLNAVYIVLENTYLAKIVLCVQFTNREERYVYNIHHKLLEIGFAKRGKDVKYSWGIGEPLHANGKHPLIKVTDVKVANEVFIFKLALPHLIFVLYTTCRCKNLASPHPINMPENISDLLS